MNNTPICTCVIKNREEEESQRDWMKRWMCMHHWIQTDYYRHKLTKCENCGQWCYDPRIDFCACGYSKKNLVEPRTGKGSLD